MRLAVATRVPYLPKPPTSATIHFRHFMSSMPSNITYMYLCHCEHSTISKSTTNHPLRLNGLPHATITMQCIFTVNHVQLVCCLSVYTSTCQFAEHAVLHFFADHYYTKCIPPVGSLPLAQNAYRTWIRVCHRVYINPRSDFAACDVLLISHIAVYIGMAGVIQH